MGLNSGQVWSSLRPPLWHGTICGDLMPRGLKVERHLFQRLGRDISPQVLGPICRFQIRVSQNLVVRIPRSHRALDEICRSAFSISDADVEDLRSHVVTRSPEVGTFRAHDRMCPCDRLWDSVCLCGNPSQRGRWPTPPGQRRREGLRDVPGQRLGKLGRTIGIGNHWLGVCAMPLSRRIRGRNLGRWVLENLDLEVHWSVTTWVPHDGRM